MKFLLRALLFPLLFAGVAVAQTSLTPTKPINLLGDPSFKDFTTQLHPERSLSEKREENWNFNQEGHLQVVGSGWGYLRTKETYKDYHLVLDYKWGERTWGSRENNARASGLFVHGHGEDAGFKGTWMQSIEAQLIEGSAGNVFILGHQETPGSEYSTRLSMTVAEDEGGILHWGPEGEEQAFPRPDGARKIHRLNRDPEWIDWRGTLGKDALDNPVGEWNRLEVICRDQSIEVYINGKLVNKGSNASPSEGYIGLLTEGAELWVRRWELWPLDQFTETWEPMVASTNTGISETGASILPRKLPWSQERSQAAWQIDGDYEIELIAAEPVVRDPVDVVWDGQGRMYVAEMGDYPLPTDIGPLMSRIRLLSDEDGDGRMDKATTWADHLDHVQGMLPMDGGLLITTRVSIMFLKDNDGDGVADEHRSLFTSNEPRHNQLQVSSPRWGLDNMVYLNNGLEGTEIYPSESPNETTQFRGRDLRYNPRTNQIGVTTGRGQFGGSLDDWGRRFFSTNRNPIIHPVMPVEALERNPAAGISLGYEDIQAQASPIYPIHISHTTSSAHLGTHTAACGLGVYRGDLMPELSGDIFVCDPTGQLVTRNRLVPNGASFAAERVGDRRDFLASSDEWTRPVQIRNGPDGALYIVDMYRRFIDHAKFFPEDFKETNYLRAGLDHGRIWRLLPKGESSPGIKPLPESNVALVQLLESPIGWQRIHAQRLLIERNAQEVVSKIEDVFEQSSSAQGRLHAFWTLFGLGVISNEQVATALEDPEPRVIENAIRLANPATHGYRLSQLAAGSPSRVSFFATLGLGSAQTQASIFFDASMKSLMNGGLSDPWIRKAILSAANPQTAEMLVTVLKTRNNLSGVSSDEFADFVREFTAETAARGDVDGLGEIVAQVIEGNPRPTEASIVEGLSQGLKRSSLPTRSIAALLNNPPAPVTQYNLSGIRAAIDSAASKALDRGLPTQERLGALSLVRELGKETIFEIAEKLIVQTEPPEIQALVCRILSGLNRSEVAQFYFDHWKSLGPIPRREALETMATNDETAMELMRRMKRGEINPAVMPAFHRWRLDRRPNKDVVAMARELFGSIDQDRAKVIADYSSALDNHEGDPQRGRVVFEKAACSTCHRVGDLGVEVGPTLADVRFKLPEALLTDILDPNRAVEERWALYTAETKNGQIFSGLIASETSSTLELKIAGGHSEMISRNQLSKLETSGQSLMPVGLEGILSKTDMADLIAFLTTP